MDGRCSTWDAITPSAVQCAKDVMCRARPGRSGRRNVRQIELYGFKPNDSPADKSVNETAGESAGWHRWQSPSAKLKFRYLYTPRSDHTRSRVPVVYLCVPDVLGCVSRLEIDICVSRRCYLALSTFDTTLYPCIATKTCYTILDVWIFERPFTRSVQYRGVRTGDCTTVVRQRH